MGKLITNGPFSIAMFVYQRVHFVALRLALWKFWLVNQCRVCPAETGERSWQRRSMGFRYTNFEHHHCCYFIATIDTIRCGSVWKWCIPPKWYFLIGKWWLANGFRGTIFSDKPMCQWTMNHQPRWEWHILSMAHWGSRRSAPSKASLIPWWLRLVIPHLATIFGGETSG